MQNFPEVKTNLLSGLTVALAMVPGAIAFALIAQVSPLTGLYAAILVCFITSVFGGRPGMVSGTAKRHKSTRTTGLGYVPGGNRCHASWSFHL